MKEERTKEAIAKRLKAAWKTRKNEISLKELAQRVEISYATVRRHMNGQNNIGIAQAQRYAGELGVPIDELIPGYNLVEKTSDTSLPIEREAIKKISTLIESYASEIGGKIDTAAKYELFLRTYARHIASGGTSSVESDLKVSLGARW